MKKNKIKFVGSDNCKKCVILFNLIKDYIKQKKLDMVIEKINAISDEAINLAIDFDINTVPFAIFKNKKIIYTKEINNNDLENFLND